MVKTYCELIKAGVLQGSILGPLLFLICINDLHNNLISNVKLFVDHTSIFSIVKDSVSTEEINNDLKRISECLCQWKMMFSPDLTKQAQEVIYYRKTVRSFHPQIFLTKFQQSAVSLRNIQVYIQIRSWILLNTLMIKSLKYKKEYQSLKNFIIFCQETCF